MSELTNFDIIELCKRLKIPIHGVFLKDKLPQICKKGNYIINLDSSYTGNQGTHWTCLICGDNDSLYFDSFGVPPPSEVARFIKTKYKKYYWSNEIIQDMDSVLCGYFCIGLFLYVKNSKSKMLTATQNYINMFMEDTKKNNKVLKNYINPKI
jgi:hypothetical protein